MSNIQINSGFENAVLSSDNTPDRVYNATDLNEHLKGLVSDYGIYATQGSACQVVASSGLKLIVKTGRGKVNNHWFKIGSDTEITLDTADVILKRIDSIVIRRSSSDRNVVIAVKKGTLSATPTAPTITRSDDVQEICLAQVYVGANVTTITASNITDTRSSNDLCGWITGLINQMDTTTLFNQYQSAQNDFITTKNTEFNTWFSGVKDDVTATSLYREYQAVYSTTTANEKTISIPSSVNYSNNGLDVLNVFINGMRLLKGKEYTINGAGTSITLNLALDVIGTDIEFVNKKSVSGTVAENVVVQVESLQTKVDKLSSCSYIATGSNDNVSISNIVKNFMNGTGSYATVSSNASMKLTVIGTISIESLIDNQVFFDFNTTGTSNRRCIIDFSNATIVSPTSPSTKQNLLAVFSVEGNIVVENANIELSNYNATTIYAFHGGEYKNCKVTINNTTATTIYGAWSCSNVSNCIFKITGSNIVYGIYSNDRCTFNNITVTGKTNYAIYSSKGIYIGNSGSGKYNYTGTSTNYIANSGFTS